MLGEGAYKDLRARFDLYCWHNISEAERKLTILGHQEGSEPTAPPRQVSCGPFLQRLAESKNLSEQSTGHAVSLLMLVLWNVFPNVTFIILSTERIMNGYFGVVGLMVGLNG